MHQHIFSGEEIFLADFDMHFGVIPTTAPSDVHLIQLQVLPLKFALRVLLESIHEEVREVGISYPRAWKGCKKRGPLVENESIMIDSEANEASAMLVMLPEAALQIPKNSADQVGKALI